MKITLAFVVAALSVNAMAIEFITEDQVAAKLGAEKVIGISKYSVETLIEKTRCAESFLSRSARVYIVKRDKKVELVLTPSGLEGLMVCQEL